jgi:propanediol dehydratase small subunit
MSAGLFLIAILGCGDGDGACQTVRTLETRYESQAACTAAAEAALLSNADADYPVVVAQCVAAGTRASVKANDVKLPAGGTAEVTRSPLRS